MKARILIIAVIVFLCALFSSCSKEEPALTIDQEEYEPEKITQNVTAELLFITRGDAQKPSNESEIENMLNLLNEKTLKEFNIDISVEWAKADGYAETVLAKIASGVHPDAIEVYFPHDVYFSLAKTDELLDIGEMFAEHMPNAYAKCRDIYPDSLDMMKYDGKDYILPTLKANPVRYCIVTDKAIYDEFGKSIETLEDYENYMQWVSSYYPDLIPGYGNLYYIFEAYLAGNGYSRAVFTTYLNIEDTEMTAYPVEKLKEFAEAYEMVARWSENKYFGDISYPTFQTAANYGQLASFFINTRDTDFRKDIMMMSTEKEYEYLILYPDTKVVMQDPQSGMVFTKGGDATERIMSFFERMYEDGEYYSLFHYGVEGENYNLKSGKLYLNMNQNLKAVAGWWGSVSIGNYNMELPIWSEPDNYAEFIDKISFRNTVSQKQIFENAGIDYDDVYRYESDTDVMAVLTSASDSLMEKRRMAFTQFMRRITFGDFSKSTEEVIETLADSNGQELADAFNSAIKRLKDN